MIRIFVDAAFKPQTHEAGLGVLLRSESFVGQSKIYVPHVENNHVAEFMALVVAFRWIEQLELPLQLVLVQTDSQVLVDAVHKRYVRNPLFKPYLKEILTLSQSFEVIIQHQNEKQNQGVDELAKQAVHQFGQFEHWEDIYE